MDRAKLKSYVAILFVFLLGVLAGGASSRAMLQRRYARLFKDRFAVVDGRRVGALSRRLNLDDKQEEDVRAVMLKYGASRRELTRDIMNKCGGPLRDQKKQMDAEIRAILRPDQQSKFDRLMQDSERRGPPPPEAGPLEPLP